MSLRLIYRRTRLVENTAVPWFKLSVFGELGLNNASVVSSSSYASMMSGLRSRPERRSQLWIWMRQLQIPVSLELLHSRRFALPTQEAHPFRPRLRERRRGRMAEPRLARPRHPRRRPRPSAPAAWARRHLLSTRRLPLHPGHNFPSPPVFGLNSAVMMALGSASPLWGWRLEESAQTVTRHGTVQDS